jgi:hypothetical protein
MLWVPYAGETQVISNSGIVGTATPWTAVPGSATTNTYGAVTELISAANNVQDSWGIEIIIANTGASATASQAALDILIGGATDDVLINSLVCGYAYGAATVSYLFPLHIPEGLRIAARVSSVRTSISCRVGCYLYGTGIDNSRGQAVVPGASGAAMSVTQMTASSTEDHFAYQIGLQPATDTTITPAGWIVTQMGAGAATEDKIGTPQWWGKTLEEYWSGPHPAMPVFAKIPAGTRLSLLSSNSGANDAAYDGHIYAVS